MNWGKTFKEELKMAKTNQKCCQQEFPWDGCYTRLVKSEAGELFGYLDSAEPEAIRIALQELKSANLERFIKLAGTIHGLMYKGMRSK